VRLDIRLALIILAGCARDDLRRANVVLIGIDNLRADHLGCYGYARPTSPHIDALSREGVLFTTTVSQAPETLPAFASIFTGLLPSHHRAGEGTLQGAMPYVSRLEGEQGRPSGGRSCLGTPRQKGATDRPRRDGGRHR